MPELVNKNSGEYANHSCVGSQEDKVDSTT